MRVSPSPKMMRDLLSAHLLDTVIRKGGGGQSRAGDRKMGTHLGGLKPRGDLSRVAAAHSYAFGRSGDRAQHDIFF